MLNSVSYLVPVRTSTFVFCDCWNVPCGIRVRMRCRKTFEFALGTITAEIIPLYFQVVVPESGGVEFYIKRGAN